MLMTAVLLLLISSCLTFGDETQATPSKPQSLYNVDEIVKGVDLEKMVKNIMKQMFNVTKGYDTKTKKPATINGLFPSEVYVL